MKETELTKSGRIAVYTAIFGKKDDLLTPRVIPPNCDFICFTDQPITSKIWEVRRVEAPLPDTTRCARRYKILAHEYLPEYELSMWVDGNVQLLKDPTPLFMKYLSDANLAVIDHGVSSIMPLHTLLEHEARLFVMDKEGKAQDDSEIIRKQGASYRSAGYPDTNGVAWTLLLLRRHNAPDLVRTMNAWWAELVAWSKRDQMSFNYVAWNEKLHFNYLPLDGTKNEYTARMNHYLSPKQKVYSLYLGILKRLRRLIGMLGTE